MSSTSDSRFSRKLVEDVQPGERIVTPVNMTVGDRVVTVMAADATGPVTRVKRGWLATTAYFQDGTSKRYRKRGVVTVT